jgi:hypothetical protein
VIWSFTAQGLALFETKIAGMTLFLPINNATLAAFYADLVMVYGRI